MVWNLELGISLELGTLARPELFIHVKQVLEPTNPISKNFRKRTQRHQRHLRHQRTQRTQRH